ncbi:MAG: general secretion pathway protein GspI [Bdellovibrio sp. ArHS]|uniref:prepilin-type N-terminal cleavage/methylation domain-containing protein n=1 Tax=Bdellovibrio sp. ArHS TaxID=1569284 RepID=UPI000583C8A0|nr:prepilin-type N-terminal cleavage/methylation domain-containing protein [Bdellovibrio sp. ArHS]KHD87748.1 MAG: general secretion pathway protein GspI [Bdellovibrio sp. ArHS]
MRNRKGFTLIETVMALVILSSGLLLLANSWSGSFMRVRKTQLSTEVAALLERKMVEVEMEYQGKPLDSIPEEKEDDFGSEYPQYSWRMTSKEFEVPDFSATLTAQAGGADELTLTIMKTLAEHLGKSIKEVKVTVIYKGAKKPLEFSATQYFVDYDKQLPLPSIPGAGG